MRLAGTDDIVEVEKVEWDNYRYHMDEHTKVIEPVRTGTFSQYPIRPAWAITVHKSQGLTFDRAVIDVHAAFSPGQAYVALSRCRSLEGLVLSAPVSASIFKTDSVVASYVRAALMDIDALAERVGYVHFDYDRGTDETAVVNVRPAGDGISATPIYNALKAWRYDRCKRDAVPPYIVLNNRTLEALCECLPGTKDALLAVKGIGPDKVSRYGDEILDIIRNYLTSGDCIRNQAGSDAGAAGDCGASGDAGDCGASGDAGLAGAGDSSQWDENSVMDDGPLPKKPDDSNGPKVSKEPALPKKPSESDASKRWSESGVSKRRSESGASKRPSESDASKKQKSWELTYELFKSGLSIGQIARERGLVASTILGHLSRYVASGELDVHEFVPEETLTRVADYKRSHPDMSGLKEIYDFYGETIPYGIIRMALAYLERQS